MRIHKYIIIMALGFIFSCGRTIPENYNNMIFINGGMFQNRKSVLHNTKVRISDFYIGKYEVTQEEWQAVMGDNPSTFRGKKLPVEGVSWYDCIEYCNARSAKEGLAPYYKIEKETKDPDNLNSGDTLKWTVSVNPKANGYRLPSEQEWEYAAGGGELSENYTYSGSNDIDDVAWYWKNSGDAELTGFWFYETIENNNCRTRPVGTLNANELGIYDMSGNVREWCWGWYGKTLNTESGTERVLRGGGWLGGESYCASSSRFRFDQYKTGRDIGLRICRSK